MPYEMGYEAVLQLYKQRNEMAPRQRCYTDYTIETASEMES